MDTLEEVQRSTIQVGECVVRTTSDALHKSGLYGRVRGQKRLLITPKQVKFEIRKSKYMEEIF